PPARSPAAAGGESPPTLEPEVAALALDSAGSDSLSGPVAEPPLEPGITLTAAPDAPADLWIQYPHARREMLKEIIFLAPFALLAWAGFVPFRCLGRVTYRPDLDTFILNPTSPFHGHASPLCPTARTGSLVRCPI